MYAVTSRKFAVLCCADETGNTNRNPFVVITLKTSVKTDGEFEVTTKYVNFLTEHIRCADSVNQKKSSLVVVNERIHGRAPAMCPYSIRIFQSLR